MPRARVVDGDSESESENAEARTCASSSPSPRGTELTRIPSRCPCSCLTGAAWLNVDARHQNFARAPELLFAPLPDPVHLLRIAVRRAACAEDRGQGHGSWAEVMAHGPRRLQHGAHLRWPMALRLRLNGNGAELVLPLGSRPAGTAVITAVRMVCAVVLRVTIIEPMNRRPQYPVLACVPCSSSTGPSDR